jgi:hypothetical protein
LTNKEKKKRTIVAIIAETKGDVLYIEKPLMQRNKVSEITLDMAANMSLITRKNVPNATRVTDRSMRKTSIKKHYKR